MALIVIEDGTATNSGVSKQVFQDLNDLSEDTLARAVLRMSLMQENDSNINDVLSDFEDTGHPQYDKEKTVAVWQDGVQTNSHFTFTLV